MKHGEFEIGKEFLCGERTWLTTDIGTRVIVAIPVDECKVKRLRGGVETTVTLTRGEAAEQGWFNGPPYSVAECVFDEDGIKGCSSL